MSDTVFFSSEKKYENSCKEFLSVFIFAMLVCVISNQLWKLWGIMPNIPNFVIEQKTIEPRTFVELHKKECRSIGRVLITGDAPIQTNTWLVWYVHGSHIFLAHPVPCAHNRHKWVFRFALFGFHKIEKKKTNFGATSVWWEY